QPTYLASCPTAPECGHRNSGLKSSHESAIIPPHESSAPGSTCGNGIERGRAPCCDASPCTSLPVYDRESYDRAWTEREFISMLLVNATGNRSAAEARCTDPPAARTARMVSGDLCA